MSYTRRMDIENMVIYTIQFLILAIKNEDILSFAGKWMELENIILCEITQTQNGMHGTKLLVSKY